MRASTFSACCASSESSSHTASLRRVTAPQASERNKTRRGTPAAARVGRNGSGMDPGVRSPTATDAEGIADIAVRAASKGSQAAHTQPQRRVTSRRGSSCGVSAREWLAGTMAPVNHRPTQWPTNNHSRPGSTCPPALRRWAPATRIHARGASKHRMGCSRSDANLVPAVAWLFVVTDRRLDVGVGTAGRQVLTLSISHVSPAQCIQACPHARAQADNHTTTRRPSGILFPR